MCSSVRSRPVALSVASTRRKRARTLSSSFSPAPPSGYETSEFCEVKTHSYSEPVSVDELEAILRDWNIEDGEAQVLGQALGVGPRNTPAGAG